MVVNKLFFSIIIPALNEETFLPLLLKDLSKQTYKNFEVIIVDGGSKDKTIIKSLAFQSRLKLKIIKSLGKNVSTQRNIGSKQSKGSYLVFFDADVRLPFDFLKILQAKIKKTNAYLFTTKLAVNNQSQAQIVLVELTNFIIETFNSLGKPFAPGFNIIIEKGLFIRLHGFDTTLKLAEDHDIVQRARKSGVLLTILKNPALFMSFRRPEKTGYLRFLTQYTISGMYTILGEPIKKDIYNYPMGGQVYLKKGNNGNGRFSPAIKKTISVFKKHLTKLRKNIELPFD